MKIAFISTRGIPNNYGGFEQFALCRQWQGHLHILLQSVDGVCLLLCERHGTGGARRASAALV